MDSLEKKHSEDIFEDEQLQDLCGFNGVACNRLEEEGENVLELEMFFTGFSTISSLQHFPNLRKLVVMHQSITRIQGLETLILLEELWLCECKITKIENLRKCEMLTKLYLYGNRISKIVNLDNLIDLQVLWLCENKISKIENLSSLKNLKDLNLAENQIIRIGDSLNNNINLESLNLSGNKIAFLKDMNDLCNLPNLKHLSFKDPYYAPCPVSLLCNYSSYALFYLPQLISLDTYNVNSKEISEIIESLVEKKNIFYNDQVKSLDYKKSCWYDVANQLKEHMLVKYHNKMKQFAEAIRKVQSSTFTEMASQPSNFPNLEKTETNAETQLELLKSKHATLTENLKTLRTAYSQCELQCTRTEKRIRLAINYVEKRYKRLVNYLQLELGTCGNIRISQCSKNDLCYDSCCNVVLSRFCPVDFQAFNVTGVEVQNIYKIVNRTLIRRLEDKMIALIPDSNDNFSFVNKVNELKKNQDYLFWIYNPELPPAMSDMEMIIENGFPASHLYERLGMNAAIPLANSLYLADRWRIHQEFISSNFENQHADACFFRHGILLMCRVYLGRSASAVSNKIICPETYKDTESVFKTKAMLNQHAEIPEVLGKHFPCSCLKDQHEWYIFNQEYIVPEYIIEFKYITMPTNENPFLLVDIGQSQNEFDKLLAHCSFPLHEITDQESIQKGINQLGDTPRDTNIMAVIHNTPIPELISHLNLSHQNLEDLPSLTAMCSLSRLEVSFNLLMKLNLDKMPLTYLDASFNNICSLKDMKNLVSLKYLDISWNKLFNIKANLTVLKENTPFIKELDTRQNPWRKPEDLRLRIIGQLPNIMTLNGSSIIESERDAAESLLTTDLICASLLETHSHVDCSEPHILSLWNMAQILTCTSLNRPGMLNEDDPACFSKITSVNLDCCQLSDLSYLCRLDQLKWISLNGNYLTTLKDLHTCSQLEEISASDNCIDHIGDLSHLIDLQRLHLGHNFIHTLKGCGLEQLSHLTYLSLESNFIQNLDGFQELSSLCQLYIGHNQIFYSGEVILIKNLKNLLIVDFRNNPMTKETGNYRLYVIFHLKGLQILDGETVDSTEIIEAKDMFGGRLTSDFISERLHGCTNHDLRELNLPNCSLRTVDLGNGDIYGKLTSINLEHNHLTSLGGLLYLHNLKVLCLNNNRIESIFPRQKWGKQKSNPANGDSEDPHDGDMDNGNCRILLKLEVLHLGYNEIRSLPQLQLHRLPSLKALFLQGNDINKLEGLEGLRNLVELVLDANKVKTISPFSFAHLYNLTELHLEENRLVSLAGLDPLSKLERLYLGSNKIQEIAEFEHLTSLSCLSDISLINNPVSKKMQMRYTLINNFPQLTAINNIAITDEDCIKAEAFMAEQIRQSNSTTASQAIMLDGGLPCISQCHLQVSSVKPTTISLCSPAIGTTSITGQDNLYTHQVDNKSTKHSLPGNRLLSVAASVLPNVTLSKNGPMPISDHPPEASYATLQEFGDSLLKTKDHSTGHH